MTAEPVGGGASVAIKLVGLVAIVALAYLGSRRKLWSARAPFALRMFLTSGLAFLLLGILLGPLAVGFLSESLLEQIRPLTFTLLAWIGFLYGAQFKPALVRSLPRAALAGGLMQAVLTFVVVWAAAMALAAVRPEWMGGAEAGRVAVALAAIASVTFPTPIALVAHAVRAQGPVTDYLRLAGGVDGGVGIVAMGALFCFHHVGGDAPDPLSGWTWLGVTVGLGLLLGYVFRIAARFEGEDDSERFAVLVGIVAFTAGVGAYTHLSPLLLGMIVGLVMIVHPASERWLDRQLVVAEHPFYLMLVIAFGAYWRPQAWIALVPAGVYLIARLLGKHLGAIAGMRLAGVRPKRAWLVGRALVPQGGIVMALGLTYAKLYGPEETHIVMTTVVVTVLVNGLVAPTLIRTVLRGEGEAA